MHKLINRNKWKQVYLGSIAERAQISSIPLVSDMQSYIGLEHLKSNDYEVEKYGSETEISVAKTKVEPGDILFARRNTYLRRVARCPISGFFSPDGYAIRSKSRDCSQDFLFWIIASSKFLDYSEKWSAGTHSKRVKWSSLEKFTFFLPTPEEQILISDFFSKIIKLKTYIKNELQCVLELQEALTRSLIQGMGDKKLGDYYELITTRTSGVELPENTNFIGLESISSETSEYLPSAVPLNYKSQVIPFRRGDILYGKLRPNLKKVLIATFDGFCSTEILVMRPKAISEKLLCTLLKSNNFYFQITRSQNGTVMPRVHERDIAKIVITDLVSESSSNACQILIASADMVVQLRSELDLLQALLNSTLEEVLG